MSFKIFLSYSAKDASVAELVKARIAEVFPCDNVEPTDVVDLQSDLVTSQDIRKSIKSAIEAASVVVVVSTESSDSSAWVNYEVGLAEALGKELVVVEQKGVINSAMHRRLLDGARIVKIETG